MSENTFQQVFEERLNSIERRAKAIGSTITEVCRVSGIARATPDRWRAEPPKSIKLMDALDAAVTKLEADAASRKVDAESVSQG